MLPDVGRYSRLLAQYLAVFVAVLAVLVWYGHAVAGHVEAARSGVALGFPWLDALGLHLSLALLIAAGGACLGLFAALDRHSHLGLLLAGAVAALVAVSPFAAHFGWFAPWEALALLPALLLPLTAEGRRVRFALALGVAVVAAAMFVQPVPAWLALALAASVLGFALLERGERLDEQISRRNANATDPAPQPDEEAAQQEASPGTQAESATPGRAAPVPATPAWMGRYAFAAGLVTAGLVLGLAFALLLPASQWLLAELAEEEGTAVDEDAATGDDDEDYDDAVDHEAAEQSDGTGEKNGEAGELEVPADADERENDREGTRRGRVGLEPEAALQFARDMPFGDLGGSEPSAFRDDVAFTVEALRRTDAEHAGESHAPDRSEWQPLPRGLAEEALELRYWQFEAFAHYDAQGFRWFRDAPRTDVLRSDADEDGWLALPGRDAAYATEPGYVLRIRLRPVHDRICPLPTPAAAIRAPAMYQSREGTVRFAATIAQTGVQYDVRPGLNRLDGATLGENARYLGVPRSLTENQRFEAWLGEIRERLDPRMGPVEVAHQVALAFDTGEYRYDTRSRLRERTDPNLELLRTYQGYCQHYASLTTMALRALDIPARVAVGFGPGYYHAEQQRLIVPANRAHAWSQVWVDGRGWVDVDPLMIARVPMAHGAGPAGRIVEGDRGWLPDQQQRDFWDERLQRDPPSAEPGNGDNESEGRSNDDDNNGDNDNDDDPSESDPSGRNDDNGEGTNNFPRLRDYDPFAEPGQSGRTPFHDRDLAGPPELDPDLFEQDDNGDDSDRNGYGRGAAFRLDRHQRVAHEDEAGDNDDDKHALQRALLLFAGLTLGAVLLVTAFAFALSYVRKRRREREAQRALREHLWEALGWDPEEETFEELLARLAKLEPLRERVIRAFHVWEALLAKAEHGRAPAETAADYATRIAIQVYEEQEPSRALATWADVLDRFIDRFERACYAPWPLVEPDGKEEGTLLNDLREIHPDPTVRNGK